MFGFEHLHNTLQQINTNNKIGESRQFYHFAYSVLTPKGELEMTMMKSFCAMSNLRGMLRGGIPSKHFEDCKEIFEKCFESDHRGSLNDVCSIPWDSSENKNALGTRNWDSCELKALKAEIQCALLMSKLESCYKTGKALMQKKVTHQGTTYASFTTNLRESQIFFQPEDFTFQVPGVIHEIFTIPGPDQ
jgi:hypothetical protein